MTIAPVFSESCFSRSEVLWVHDLEERESKASVFGRVGMKRLPSSPRQVSSSPAPNRTCEFPRIRLSMRGFGHGWPSQ